MSWLTPFFCGKIEFLTVAEKAMPIQPLSYTVSHLGCSRNEQLLFKPISFTLESGRGLVVMGANGIGKTTLLRVLAGLLPPACGQINRNEGYRVAYLGPHHALKGTLTPTEQLRYASVANHSQIVAALAQVELLALSDMPCAHLSSGQKQRVALAQVALSAAPIWLLDEPMNALDSRGVALFITLLAQHLARGGMAVIATHQDIPMTGLHTLTLET